MGFHASDTFFEVLRGLEPFGDRGIGSLLLPLDVLCFGLGDGYVVIIVGLLQVNILGGEFVLSVFVRNSFVGVVLWVLEGSLSLPVGSGTVGDPGLRPVNDDRLLLDVATSKNTRLEVLVFTVFGVHTAVIDFLSLDSLHRWVFPVDVLSHQASVVFRLMVHSLGVHRFTVELSFDLGFGGDNCLIGQFGVLGR